VCQMGLAGKLWCRPWGGRQIIVSQTTSGHDDVHRDWAQRSCNAMASAHARFGSSNRVAKAMGKGKGKGTGAQMQWRDLLWCSRSSPPVSGTEGNVAKGNASQSALSLCEARGAVTQQVGNAQI
jgi:hypothetical protein